MRTGALIVILALGVTIIGNAQAAEFDSIAFCKELMAGSDGAYEEENICRDMEATAKAELEAMVLEPRIERYCSMIGQITGGSYEIMLRCVEHELQAKQGSGQ